MFGITMDTISESPTVYPLSVIQNKSLSQMLLKSGLLSLVAMLYHVGGMQLPGMGEGGI